MSHSSPVHDDRPVAVGVFEGESDARRAIESLRGGGLKEQQVACVGPNTTEGTGLLGGAAVGGDLVGALVNVGVPEGEARFYAQEVQAGRTLVVLDARESGYARARDLLGEHGARDVQSQGAELVRGAETPDGVPGGATSPDADLTDRWEDVRSRYEMLFEQHYGTTDTAWPQIEPLYRHAWQMANAPALRGRPWPEAEATLRRDWESQPGGAAWTEVAGPMRDVWEDVAAEAGTPEGGSERRVARQGADQSGPAREVVPPPGPA